MEDIRSWWEVPSIAHFCSLFRTAFGLTDFEIEDLEEALLSDGTVDGGSTLNSTFLGDLHARLLRGLFETNDIHADNFEPFLSQVLKIRWEDELNKENPLKDNSYSSLPVQQKVEILHNLCDFRLDVADVQDLLKGLDADSLRVEPLGRDSQGNIYWYFYGTRLYKETPAETPEEKEKRKQKKKKKLAAKKKKRKRKKVKGKRKQKKKASSDSESDFVTSSSSDNFTSEEEEEDLDSESEEENQSNTPKWSLICATASEWEELSESFKKSKHRDEKLLYQTLSEDFVPEIEKMIEAKDRAYQKKLLELAPRRASTRIAIKMSLKEDSDIRDFEESEEKVNERERLAEEKRIEEEEKQKERDKLAEKRQQERAERARLREERLWMRMNGEFSEDSSMPENGNEERREESASSKKERMPEFDGDDDRDEDLYTGMYKVLDYLKKHNNAWPFLEPVDESYAPQYHEIIESPMDLSTIEEKLDKGEYKKLEHFQDDMQLMFDNCDEYNGPDSMYTKMANTLKAAFERQIKKHFPDDEDNSDEDYEEELRKGRRKEREREMKGKQKSQFSMNDFMRNRQENQPGSQAMGGGSMPFPFMGEMGMNRVPNPMMAASRHPQDFQFPPGVPPGFGPDGRPVYPPQFYQNYYNATMARFNMPQQRQFNPYQYQPPPLTRAPMGDPQRMQFPQQGMDGRMPYQRPSPNGMTPPGLSRMQGPPRLGLPPGVAQGPGGMPTRPQMPPHQPGSQMMPETSQQQSSNQSSPPTSQSVVTSQPQQQQIPDQFRPSGIGTRPGGFPIQMPPNHSGSVPGQFPGYPNMNGPPRLQRAPMEQMAQNRMVPYGQNMAPGYGMGPRAQLPPGFMPSSQGPPKSLGAPTVSVPSSTGASGSALTSPATSDASGEEKKTLEKDPAATASPVPRSTPVSTSGEPTPSSFTAEKEKRESEQAQAVAMSRPQSFGQPFPQQAYYGRPMAPYPQGMPQGMRPMPQERHTNVITGPSGPIVSEPIKPVEQSQSDPAIPKDASTPTLQPKLEGPSNQVMSRPQGAPTPPNVVPREQMEQTSKNKGVGMSISQILGSPSRDTSSPRASENRAPVITISRRSPPPLVSDLRRPSDKAKSDSNRSSPLVEGPSQAPPERPPSGYKSWPPDQGPPRQGSPNLAAGRPRGFLEELFNGKPPVSKDMDPVGEPSAAQGSQRLPFTSLLKEIAPQRASPGKEGPVMALDSSGSDPQALGRGLGGMNQAHKDFMTRNYLRGQGDPQRYGIPKQMGPYSMYPGKMGPEGMSPLAFRSQGQDMASVERERAMQLAGKRTPDGQFVDLDAMQYREQPGYPTPEQLFLLEQRRQQERMASSRGSVIGGDGMHMMRYPGNMMLRQQQEQQYLQAMYSNRMRNGEYTSSASEDAPSSKIPRFS